MQDPNVEPTWPRVLVLSANPFNIRTNNGLTLSSLFRGWPSDALAQVFVPFVTPIAAESSVCNRFWTVTPLGLQPHVPSSAPSQPTSSPSRARRALLRAAERPNVVALAQPARELYYSLPLHWRGRAWREIERFAPQVVFSTLGSLSLGKMALRLSERLGAVLVPFVTDDWPETEYANALFGSVMRRALLRDFDRILESTPVRMVISPSMARAYEQRYGGAFEPFTQCIDAERFVPTPPPPKERIRLIYAGQLGLNRWEQLRRIGLALVELRKERIDAELVVYSSPSMLALHADALRAVETIRIGGHVSSNELPPIYQESDILVHVETFSPDWTRYIRYSMSTKLTEYMMAARPIFGFGPLVGSLEYVRDTGAGIVVHDDSDAALTGALRDLIRDAATREKLATAGRAHALAHHEAKATRERFRRLLAFASESRGLRR